MLTELKSTDIFPKASYSLRETNAYDHCHFEIVRECGGSVALPLLGLEELKGFVSFLNDNTVEPVHILDCFRDYVYEKLFID